MPLPSFNTMLSQLLSTNSVSAFDPSWDTGNLTVINQLAQWLEELGFQCDIQALPDQPHKANLVATLGQGNGGLVFAGHTDTVPFDESGWRFEPLAATEADNRFYGLGSCDMKGFFAVIIDALRSLEGQPPKEPIIIVATADEESSMAGAEALAAAGKLHGRCAIIGEPTSLVPITAHKSITMQRITVNGQSGHSSNPTLGYSALEVMHEVMGELLQYRQALQSANQNPQFDIHTATMNLGCIHGGDSANRICAKCHLDIDLRLLPGMNNQTELQHIEQRLRAVEGRHKVSIELSPLFNGVDPFDQARDSDIVKTVETLTGTASQTVAFATEAPYFQQLGFQTVVLGPGSIDQAHQPNEFLPLDAIKPTQALALSLIKHYCY